MQTIESPASSAPKTSGLAIASLVTGLTCIAPLAIIFDHMALSRIKSSAGQLTGSGLALAGTILGYVGVVFLIFGIIPVMFVGARAWKQGSDRAGCIILQRKIQEGVRNYQIEKGLQPGADLDVEAIQQKLGGPSAVTCPAGGTIVIYNTVPETDAPACECPHQEDLKHAPLDRRAP